MSHTYLSNGTNATGLVSRLKYTNLFEGHSSLGSGEFALRTFDYTYDANGNIKTVTTDGVLTDSYTYDGLNQLVRHDDASAGKSYVYSYDAGGNITSKKEYVYTTGTLGTVLSEKSYAYDSVWKDKLVSYDGKAITYDEIGTPLTFDGYTFSWQKGRQLASIDGNGVNLDFKYNSDGLRTKKISSDKTIEYYYSGSVLMAQYDGTNWLKFCYSADGEIVGFAYNNTPYYFVKNLQGDIIGIMNSASELVCTYKYDAWGKCTVYDSSGTVNTSTTFIGNVNPLRYRGYYYDAETGLYYASSRYYNPEICRWINADNIVLEVVGNIYDYNLYAYCNQKQTNLISNDISFGEQTTGLYKSVSPEFSIPKNPTPDSIVYYDVPLYNQKGYSLCWAFCQVMVEDYKFGRTRTNEQATERAISISRSVYGDDWNQGGWPTNSRDLFGDTGITSLDDLYSALVSNGPIYAYYGGADGAHLVVITGVNKSKGIIYTNNPWGIAGEQTYSQFLHGFVGMPSYWDMPFGFYIFTQ